MSDANEAKPLAGAKKGNWIITKDDTCYQLTSGPDRNGDFKIGKYGLVTAAGQYFFGGSRNGDCHLATAEELAAWRKREEEKEAKAKADADEWHADERIRDAARELLAACKAVLAGDPDGRGLRDEVLTQVVAAVAKAEGK